MNEDVLERIADELMINNMINAINSPTISQEFLINERIRILTMIKQHILKNTEKLNDTNHTKKRQ